MGEQIPSVYLNSLKEGSQNRKCQVMMIMSVCISFLTITLHNTSTWKKTTSFPILQGQEILKFFTVLKMLLLLTLLQKHTLPRTPFMHAKGNNKHAETENGICSFYSLPSLSLSDICAFCVFCHLLLSVNVRER